MDRISLKLFLVATVILATSPCFASRNFQHAKRVSSKGLSEPAPEIQEEDYDVDDDFNFRPHSEPVEPDSTHIRENPSLGKKETVSLETEKRPPPLKISDLPWTDPEDQEVSDSYDHDETKFPNHEDSQPAGRLSATAPVKTVSHGVDLHRTQRFSVKAPRMGSLLEEEAVKHFGSGKEYLFATRIGASDRSSDGSEKTGVPEMGRRQFSVPEMFSPSLFTRDLHRPLVPPSAPNNMPPQPTIPMHPPARHFNQMPPAMMPPLLPVPPERSITMPMELPPPPSRMIPPPPSAVPSPMFSQPPPMNFDTRPQQLPQGSPQAPTGSSQPNQEPLQAPSPPPAEPPAESPGTSDKNAAQEQAKKMLEMIVPLLPGNEGLESQYEDEDDMGGGWPFADMMVPLSVASLPARLQKMPRHHENLEEHPPQQNVTQQLPPRPAHPPPQLPMNMPFAPGGSPQMPIQQQNNAPQLHHGPPRPPQGPSEIRGHHPLSPPQFSRGPPQFSGPQPMPSQPGGMPPQRPPNPPQMPPPGAAHMPFGLHGNHAPISPGSSPPRNQVSPQFPDGHPQTSPHRFVPQGPPQLPPSPPHAPPQLPPGPPHPPPQFPPQHQQMQPQPPPRQPPQFPPQHQQMQPQPPPHPPPQFPPQHQQMQPQPLPGPAHPPPQFPPQHHQMQPQPQPLPGPPHPPQFPPQHRQMQPQPPAGPPYPPPQFPPERQQMPTQPPPGLPQGPPQIPHVIPTGPPQIPSPSPEGQRPKMIMHPHGPPSQPQQQPTPLSHGPPPEPQQQPPYLFSPPNDMRPQLPSETPHWQPAAPPSAPTAQQFSASPSDVQQQRQMPVGLPHVEQLMPARPPQAPQLPPELPQVPTRPSSTPTHPNQGSMHPSPQQHPEHLSPTEYRPLPQTPEHFPTRSHPEPSQSHLQMPSGAPLPHQHLTTDQPQSFPVRSMPSQGQTNQLQQNLASTAQAGPTLPSPALAQILLLHRLSMLQQGSLMPSQSAVKPPMSNLPIALQMNAIRNKAENGCQNLIPDPALSQIDATKLSPLEKLALIQFFMKAFTSESKLGTCSTGCSQIKPT